MAAIYWLIPLSIIVLCLAVAVFLWAIQNGQYDDLESASAELLFEDEGHVGLIEKKNHITPNNQPKTKMKISND